MNNIVLESDYTSCIAGFCALSTASCSSLIVPQLDPGNKDAVRAARRIKDKVAKAAKENSPIRQVCICNTTPLYHSRHAGYRHTMALVRKYDEGVRSISIVMY